MTLTRTVYSNVPSFPSSYYDASSKILSKTVSVAADRYTIQLPQYMDLDVGGLSYQLATQTYLDCSSAEQWDTTSGTDYTVAANRAGLDFYVYACQPTSGIVPTTLMSANATYPHGYTALNSRKIGGFHCLCGSVGTISNHTLTGYLTGDILPASVWCLKHRHITGDNRGMVYIEPLNKWAYIYNASGTQFIPVSAFGGTILDTITWFQGRDAASRVGMKLPTDAEFGVLAAGSNEGTNILGSADPVTVTAAVDTAGRRMISNYGCEGCCGIQVQWLDVLGYRFDGAAAHTHTIAVTGDAGTFTSGNPSADVAPSWSYKANTNYKGSLYTQGTYGIVSELGGCGWGSGTNCGTLGRFMNSNPWTGGSTAGIRFIGNNIEK